MKTALFIGIWLTLCSITCSNSNAMDKTLKNIAALAAATQVDKTTAEAMLGIKLSEDKQASARQGITIYELNMGTFLGDYVKVELRLFDGSKKFFMLLYPHDPVPFSLEELKKEYHYKSFTTADARRKEPPGYHFEKDGRNIRFYCDDKLKRIVYISIEGNNP